MGHHEKTGNDSTTKFAVIFALLFFFGVTVAANHYFVGSEAGESVEHAVSSDDATAEPAKDDASDSEKHKSSGRKKH